MSPLRLWMILTLILGGLVGYIVASGIGVAFMGATSLPRVHEIWWMPIPLSLFLFVFRLVYHEELHGKVSDDAKHQEH